MAQLKDSYGSEFPEVNKFHQLVKRLDIDADDHQDKILKVVKAVGDYCSANADLIKARDVAGLPQGKCITYNDKIFIDVKKIVDASDEASQSVIADHLQYLLYLIHPDGELKEALVVKAEEQKSNVNPEDNFFASLLGQIESTNPNPQGDMSGFMDAIQNQVMNGIENQQLDPNRLIQSAFGMFNQLKTQAGGNADPEVAGMFSMVESILMNATSGQSPF